MGGRKVQKIKRKKGNWGKALRKNPYAKKNENTEGGGGVRKPGDSK